MATMAGNESTKYFRIQYRCGQCMKVFSYQGGGPAPAITHKLCKMAFRRQDCTMSWWNMAIFIVVCFTVLCAIWLKITFIPEIFKIVRMVTSYPVQDQQQSRYGPSQWETSMRDTVMMQWRLSLAGRIARLIHEDYHEKISKFGRTDKNWLSMAILIAISFMLMCITPSNI